MNEDLTSRRAMTGPAGIVVRRAVADDVPALAELHLDVWDEAYAGLVPQSVLDARRARPTEQRTERWRRVMAHVPTWVAARDDDLLGFVNAGPGRDESGDLEVMALYVRAAVYGHGIGHRLLHTAIGSRPAYLWVLDGNSRAIAFYERQGFGFDGRTKTEDEGLERRMVRH